MFDGRMVFLGGHPANIINANAMEIVTAECELSL